MNVFKYGVETATFKNLFDFIMSTNAYVGIKSSTRKEKPSALDILKLIPYNIPTGLVIVFIIISTLSDTNLDIIGIGLLVLSGEFFNIAPKLLTWFFRGQQIREIMDIVIDETSNESLQFADDTHKGLLRKYLTTAKMVSNIEVCSFVITFFVMYISPYLFSIATSRWMNPIGVNIVGIDENTHPGYDIHILLTQYFGFHAMVLIGTADMMFYYCTLYIAYQLDVCKHLVSKLGDERISQIDTSKLLRKIAVIHSNVYRFCQLCTRAFEWVLFFEVPSVSMCLSISLTMHNVNPWLLTMSITFVGLQFLICCLFAELVKTKSQETSRAFYLSDWSRLIPKSDKQLFVLLLQFSQSDLSFSPFNWIALSLETFVKVLRAAFSYYTFLKSVI